METNENNEDEDEEKDDDEGNNRRSNYGGMFGHESTLSQDVVDILARKYGISNIYYYRALGRGEYMFDLGDREIAVMVGHLKVGFRLPFHPFFI